jgi:AcrR family transcriptional regulator
MTDVAVRADARRNRVRILEAAQRAITEIGIDVSMDDIAKLADVGKGTLYRHFASREDLLTAILEARVERIEAVADEAVADGAEGFAHFIRWTAELQAGNESLYGVLRRLRKTHPGAAVWDERIMAAAHRVYDAGRQAGVVGEQVQERDLGPVIRMLAAAARASAAEGETPKVEQRHLDIVLRGVAPSD